MNTDYPKISIVILCWNSANYLSDCLSSLQAQTFQNFEIIIVDNNSTDGSIDQLELQSFDMDLIITRLEKNFGFAAGNNIGVQKARGKWIALLNVDAFPKPNWLEKLLEAVTENPDFSFFSSRQVQANSPQLLDGAGDAYHISGLAWRHGYNQPNAEYENKQKEVFSACAASALFSREEFLSTGGFDIDYFSYFEDVDLSFRLRLARKKCLYVPEAMVHHIGSASTGKRSDFSVYYGYRNMIWTFFKNMPSPLIWFFLPLHVATVIFFVIYLMLRGQGRVILKAVVDAIQGLPKIWRKRKDIQRNIKINPFELLNVMSTRLLEPYKEFIHRKKTK